jgi:hypothetical protein
VSRTPFSSVVQMHGTVRNSAGDKAVLFRGNGVNDPKTLVDKSDDPAPPASLAYKK